MKRKHRTVKQDKLARMLRALNDIGFPIPWELLVNAQNRLFAWRLKRELKRYYAKDSANE